MFFGSLLNTPNYFKPQNAINTQEEMNLPKNFGLLNYSKTSYSDFLNDYKPVPKTSKFSNFFENVGGYGGLEMLTGAIGGLGSLIIGSINANEQNKRSKEGMQMARDQYQRENERYELREKERLYNNEQINNIAKKYSSVMIKI
ncbi:hypothetical protein HpVH12_14510 [Helicobacter pylori]